MRRIVLVILLAIVSNSAKAEFTCEKIKDKATRASCIEDRVGKEKTAEKKEEGKAIITKKCSLNGRGEASCSYHNSGNIDGSICHYLMLVANTAKPETKIATEKYLAEVGAKSEKLCSGIVKAGDLRDNKTVVGFGESKSNPHDMFNFIPGFAWTDLVSFVIVEE